MARSLTSLSLWQRDAQTVLAKYKLDEFILLTDGIRKGDLRTFNNALIDNQHRFIRYVDFDFPLLQ